MKHSDVKIGNNKGAEKVPCVTGRSNKYPTFESSIGYSYGRNDYKHIFLVIVPCGGQRIPMALENPVEHMCVDDFSLMGRDRQL